MKTKLIMALLLLLGACSSDPWRENFTAEEEALLFSDMSLMRPESKISLKNLTSHIIVHCYNSPQESAESCARYFESQNYVRFRDIPYKTAGFDYLKTDTYPTRRWRDGEITPRW